MVPRLSRRISVAPHDVYLPVINSSCSAMQRLAVILTVVCFGTPAAFKKPLFVSVIVPSERNEYYYSKLSVPAIRMAVDHINNNSYLLPDHEIVLSVNDSRCDIGLASYQMHRMLSANTTKIALIAAGCSAVTLSLAHVSQYWNIPQFNFLSSSPALDDRKVLGQYYHLLPSENSFNPARVKLMIDLEWRRSVVLVQPSTIFNLNSRDLVVEMAHEGLERPEMILLPDDNDFDSVIDRIKELDVRVLFGLVYEEKARKLVCSCYKRGIAASTSFVWMLPGWYDDKLWWNYQGNGTAHDCMDSEMRDALNGHFSFDYAQLSPDPNFINRTLLTNKTVLEVAAEFQNRNNMSKTLNVTETFKGYSAYGYDAMLSIGLLLDMAIKNYTKIGNRDRIDEFSYEYDDVMTLFNNILMSEDFKFKGLTGDVQFYNLLRSEERQSADGFIVIRYVQAPELGGDDDDLVAQNEDDNPVAVYDSANGKMKWEQPNIPWTTPDGLRPVDERTKELIYSNKSVFIAIAILSSFGITFAVILLTFNVIYRRHWVIRKSIRRLNDIVLYAALVSYISIILFGFDGQFFPFNQTSIICCFLRTIFLVLAFTICFGSLLTKTCAEVLERFVKRPFNSLIIIVGVFTYGFLLLVDTLMLILWTAIDSWEKKQSILKDDGKAIYIREKCSTGVLWAYAFVFYKLIVLVICAVATFVRIRIVGKKAAVGSPYIDLLMSFTAFVLFFMVFAFTFTSDAGEQYGLVSGGLLLLITTILCLWFVPKVRTVLTGKIEGKKEEENSVVGNLTEIERSELKELRSRNTEQKDLLGKLLLELPQSPTGPLGETVRSAMGCVP